MTDDEMTVFVMKIVVSINWFCLLNAVVVFLLSVFTDTSKNIVVVLEA